MARRKRQGKPLRGICYVALQQQNRFEYANYMIDKYIFIAM
jgi:hypothetical protein